MNITNKLIDILSLQSIAVKVKSAYKNIQKVFDAGYASGYEEGVKTDPQWNAYCLKTGEHFDLPEGMAVIPEYMFVRHSNLKTIDIPTTVKVIENSAFDSSSVRIGQFPENLETIMYDAFINCQNNDVLVFSPSIIEIGSDAFYGNANLTEVTFVKTNDKAGTPTELDKFAFANCPNLTTIRVPWAEGEVAGEFDADGNRINWGAENATVVHNFWDTAITSEVFTFPQGFIKIPDNLFRSTTATAAKEIYLGDECKEVGAGSFYKATNLETVHMPEGLTKIGDYGFRHCAALKLSAFPDSLETIGNYAFQNGTSILEIKFPKSLKKIGIRSFYNCTGLTRATFSGNSVVSIHRSAFSGCTNLVEICVPWSEGEVSGAPWGAANATIIYDWKEG